MSLRPDTEAHTAPTLTFRYEQYHQGLALILTVTGGEWRWRLDHPAAHNSPAYRSHPACKAAARHALGLPAIGQAGTHLTADCLPS
jgi:hypothetical protein